MANLVKLHQSQKDIFGVILFPLVLPHILSLLHQTTSDTYLDLWVLQDLQSSSWILGNGVAGALVDPRDAAVLLNDFRGNISNGYEPGYPTWISTSDCDNWNGVSCDSSGRVTNIYLYDNALSGTIPTTLGDLTNLGWIYLWNNALSGSIPATLGSLTNLQYLSLSNNSLSGNIPTTLSSLPNLQVLELSNNALSSNIPTTLGNLTKLLELKLHNNELSGNIPATLGSLTNLQKLYLWNNALSGNIPTTVGSLTDLQSLDLRNNELSGNIPTTLGNLTYLQELDISNNSLSGSIPESLGSLQSLTYLNVTCNNLSGIIPATLVNREGFYLADGNNFSLPITTTPTGNSSSSPVPIAPTGSSNSSVPIPSTGNSSNSSVPIPSTGNSSNSSAPIPSTGNSSTANGGIPIYAILIIVVGLLVVAGIALWFTLRRCLPARHLGRQSSFDKKIQELFVQPIPLAVVEIASANFSPDNILGEGGYGVVYKGNAPHGGLWAIKRAKMVSKQTLADFQNEINFISRMSHVNILSLRAYCSQGGEQILIYDFMVNGSLKSRLQLKDSAGTPPLNFEQRLVIAMGAAEGLKYLHHLAQPTIIHRDVKTDNILLNNKLQALVADFGLLKDNEPVDVGQPTTRRMVGTPGYMDPEYHGTQATTKSDVYSFGVVLFEIITGKGPLVMYEQSHHEMHGQNRFSLVSLVLELNNSKGVWLVDPLLNQFSASAMRALCELAKSCVSKRAIDRPTMREVVVQLGIIYEMVGQDQEGSLASDFICDWDISNIVGRTNEEIINNSTWQQSISQFGQSFATSVQFR